jgi:hypothetical protein
LRQLPAILRHINVQANTHIINSVSLNTHSSPSLVDTTAANSFHCFLESPRYTLSSLPPTLLPPPTPTPPTHDDFKICHHDDGVPRRFYSGIGLYSSPE